MMGRLCCLWGLIAVGLVGCASYESPFVSKSEAELDAMEAVNSSAAEHFHAQSYAEAESLLGTLDHEQTVSSPQYMLERASVLLMTGRHEEAHKLMMSAREHIETLFDPDSEEKAVSFWHGENNKVFKGDNHERATLYALLALSFIEREAWEDALRCVKNGLLADLSTEDNVYNSDYAMLHYLGYVAAKRMGDAGAAEDYKREFMGCLQARGIRADDPKTCYARLFEEPVEPNALMVIWTGRSPTFLRGGEYEELRMVVPGANPYTVMTAEIDGDGIQRTLPKAVGDVNFQATTRGGREMDHVLENKAALKKGMEVSRNIAMAMAVGCFIAASQQSDPNTALICCAVGGGCFAIGVIPWIIGACINTDADIRHWHNLPAEFLLLPMHLSPGQHEITVRAYDRHDMFVYEKIPLTVRETPLAVYHVPVIQDRLMAGENATTVLQFFSVYAEGCRILAQRCCEIYDNWMKEEVRWE